MKNVLFIGHFLPNGRNVYETNLITELKKQVDKLEVITVNKGYNELETSFQNIPIYAVKAVKKPIIDEAIRFWDMLKLLRRWYKKNANRNDKRIILLNSSIEINLAVIVVSKLYKIKTSSLLIDTALGNFKPDTLWNKYMFFCYKYGEKLYKYLDGSMALNPKVFQHLKLCEKPTHLTKIGFSRTHNYPDSKKRSTKKKIVYTGSLMYYDGTEELLNAVSRLSNEDIELKVYGNGPLKSMVETYASQYEHINYMGYLSNEKIGRVLQEADFLINPRISYFYTDIFGFPSKMVEYLLSGTPVITTSFSAMPKEYRDFVYLISEETAKGIEKSIVEAVHDDPETQEKMVKNAYDYIKKHNGYESIVREMVKFVYSL